MGEMRDSDWSRPKILRSDWLGLIGSIITTFTGSGNVLRGSLQSIVLTDIQSTTDLESLREKILILSDTMRLVSVLRIVSYY